MDTARPAPSPGPTTAAVGSIGGRCPAPAVRPYGSVLSRRWSLLRPSATAAARRTDRRLKSHVDSGAPSNPTGIDTYVHYYHNTAWQILETRQPDTQSTQPETLQPKHQYVWSQRYIDAAVLRDENTGTNGLCDDQRLYYLNDANFTASAAEIDAVHVGRESFSATTNPMETSLKTTPDPVRRFHRDIQGWVHRKRHRDMLVAWRWQIRF